MPFKLTNAILPLCLTILLMGVGAPGQAVELPDLGDVSRVTLSEARESAIGREVMRQIRQERAFLDDPEINDYLNRLGDRLAASQSNPGYSFQFFAVSDPSINAFALPGGFIGVHTGLIAAARNESELAGVLAHEMAHVTQNHIARMVDGQRGRAWQTLAALAVALLAARSDQGELGQAAVVTAQALGMQNQLDFTREHEKEADRVGLRILSDASFDPGGMASFFERLQAQGRHYDHAAPAYLRTHPLTHERIADIQDRLSGLTKRPGRDESLDFRLVQAKVNALSGDPESAQRRFQADLQQRPDDVATRYGLAAAALRAGNNDQIRTGLAALPDPAPSYMVDALAARLMFTMGNYPGGLKRLQEAMRRHGETLPLVDAYARGAILAGQPAQARQRLTDALRVWPGEVALLDRLSEANFALGRQAEGHLIKAEALYGRDLVAAALEQLDLARKAGDGDYYTLSIVDARMRAWRQSLPPVTEAKVSR